MVKVDVEALLDHLGATTTCLKDGADYLSRKVPSAIAGGTFGGEAAMQKRYLFSPNTDFTASYVS